jgi:hypothetical protein
MRFILQINKHLLKINIATATVIYRGNIEIKEVSVLKKKILLKLLQQSGEVGDEGERLRR